MKKTMFAVGLVIASLIVTPAFAGDAAPAAAPAAKVAPAAKAEKAAKHEKAAKPAKMTAEEKFAKEKATSVESIDKRVAKLGEKKACVEAAMKAGELKACNKKFKGM